MTEPQHELEHIETLKKDIQRSFKMPEETQNQLEELLAKARDIVDESESRFVQARSAGRDYPRDEVFPSDVSSLKPSPSELSIRYGTKK